jgi:hypothetical protein
MLFGVKFNIITVLLEYLYYEIFCAEKQKILPFVIATTVILLSVGVL